MFTKHGILLNVTYLKEDYLMKKKHITLLTSLIIAIAFLINGGVVKAQDVSKAELTADINYQDPSITDLMSNSDYFSIGLLNEKVAAIKEQNPGINDSDIVTKVISVPLVSKTNRSVPTGVATLALVGYRKDNSTFNVSYYTKNTLGVDGVVYADFSAVTADGSQTESWIWKKATSGGGLADGNKDVHFAPAEWNYAGLTFGYMTVPYPYESPAPFTPGGINFK